MTRTVQVATVASADKSLPAKQAMRSGRETLAAWQARALEAYIVSHLHSTIRVVELVRAVQVTPNRFFRLFKKRFGCTPHQYVMRARIARAQRLLLMSEDTLNGIAAECGFGSKSHLANLFRNATGRPPGQWRRIHATPVGMRSMRASTRKRDVSASTILLDRLAMPPSVSESGIFANCGKSDSIYEADLCAALDKSAQAKSGDLDHPSSSSSLRLPPCATTSTRSWPGTPSDRSPQ
jgi:AraC-like DNA-binding protein